MRIWARREGGRQERAEAGAKRAGEAGEKQAEKRARSGGQAGLPDRITGYCQDHEMWSTVVTWYLKNQVKATNDGIGDATSRLTNAWENAYNVRKSTVSVLALKTAAGQ